MIIQTNDRRRPPPIKNPKRRQRIRPKPEGTCAFCDLGINPEGPAGHFVAARNGNASHWHRCRNQPRRHAALLSPSLQH
jgi:hypothetical protein